MSSTNRGGARLNNDAYYTPAWCVHRLLEAVTLPGGVWVEPCVGKGSIINAINMLRHDISWFTNDIVPTTTYAQTTQDARKYKINISANVIITNPPFSVAQEILENCLKSSALTVFLQRLNWCAGPRAELFRRIEPSVYVLPNRPGFAKFISCSRKKQGCEFSVVLAIEDETIKICPSCGSKTKVSTSDSIEYAWYVFDGKGNFGVLADTPLAERRRQ